MGNCIYCGKSAGLLRSKHPDCETQHGQRQSAIQSGRQQIVSEVLKAIHGKGAFDGLGSTIAQIEQTASVPPVERRQHLVRGWEAAVEMYLEDGILDAEEETRLVEFKDHFRLSQDELDKNGAMTKTAKAGILREVLRGVIPQRIAIDGSLPINFQKGEQIVWVFPGSHYLEDKTRRQFVGRSQGVSVRIMKGVYYRTGAFKGHSVQHTERVHIDTGFVVLTNKNIYFAGPSKSLRLPYAKVVSFEPFSDGLGIMRDVATAKPQVFVTGDGWFTYNLVMNLSQM